MPSLRPLRVIWSAMHTGGMVESHFHTVIDRAAEQGVSGVEISGGSIERYISYRGYPVLAKLMDTSTQRPNHDLLRRICEHCEEKKLRLGIWHHEIEGPHGMLDAMPELKAADGLIDLDSPKLYGLITDRLNEFFDLYPQVDEIILTMTETKFPVFRRPFCSIPIAERVRRLLEAVSAATEPRGKQMVVRPFSAVRADEIHVREAVESLKAKNVTVMYKTEPFDWHPFLMNEPLIGSVPRYEARAETDAGAEYYGQTVFPCSYAKHLEYRLRPAAEKGATVATIRVDRGAHHSGLGHPINEGNSVAPTQWLMHPEKSIRDHWLDWCRTRHGYASTELYEILERTFDVIKKSLYIDQQAFTHNLFPDLRGCKHVQGFGFFEEGVSLTHMSRNWGVIAERRTLTHEGILAEKNEAIRVASEIIRDFEQASGKMPQESREAILESLRNLPILAEACMVFCRVVMAHLEEVWKRSVRVVDSFDAEVRRLLDMADRIEREKGSGFWMNMPKRMRDIAEGLAAERKLELPLRQKVENLPGLVDYVLCGFASEGHRQSKMLHSGSTFAFNGQLVRATGQGPEQSFSYVLKGCPGKAARLVVSVAGENGEARPGIIRIGKAEHRLNAGSLNGFKELSFDVPAPEAEIPVEIWSSTPASVWVAQIALLARA